MPGRCANIAPVADDDRQILWIDGDLRPAAEAAVSPFDHGVTVGDGVFETMKVLRGEAFALRRHLERLRRSAAGLGLDVPFDDACLRAAVSDVIRQNPEQAGRVRLTVTGGVGPLGSERSTVPPTVIIAASALAPRRAASLVVTVPWPRNERGALAGLKTTSYAENVVALRRAQAAGADEAIFANTAGLLCEGSGSNIFVVVEGRLITPTLASGCLAGVTRALLVEQPGLVVEADLPASTLTRADEAFLTSSTRDVQPIAAVDSHPLPSCPGPLTQVAIDAFRAIEAESTDP